MATTVNLVAPIEPIPVVSSRPLRYKLIAFVNPKSGGLQGERVYAALIKLIGAANVYNLVEDKGPQRGFNENRNEINLRIIACGGDGTVGWLLSKLDESDLKYKDFVSVGVIPLGTGNDMARFLGWGKGYREQTLSSLVELMKVAEPLLLDRWSIKTQSTDLTLARELKIPQSVFNNYFSFGADAQIALDFHHKRNENPRCFSNQFINKLAYGCISCRTFCSCRYLCHNIGSAFQLLADEIDISEAIRRFGPDAILFLNIASYAAGTNPWQGDLDNLWCASSRIEDERFFPQSCSDGFLEIIAFKNIELARIRLGRRAQRIGQARKVQLIFSEEMPMEIDGEPFSLPPCQINIELKNQAHMVKNERSRANQQISS